MRVGNKYSTSDLRYIPFSLPCMGLVSCLGHETCYCFDDHSRLVFWVAEGVRGRVCVRLSPTLRGRREPLRMGAVTMRAVRFAFSSSFGTLLGAALVPFPVFGLVRGIAHRMRHMQRGRPCNNCAAGCGDILWKGSSQLTKYALIHHGISGEALGRAARSSRIALKLCAFHCASAC